MLLSTILKSKTDKKLSPSILFLKNTKSPNLQEKREKNAQKTQHLNDTKFWKKFY